MTVSTPRRPGPDLSEIELDALLKRLHLANLRRVFRDAITKAEMEQWSYRDFLALLMAEEVAHRKQTRLQRLTRRARFPYLKTIEDFDFTLQSNLRVSLLGSYLGPDFVTEGRSLILHERAGRGKTHLAVAIGYRAIQNGFETRFTTAAQLIEDLSNAGRNGRLHDALEAYTHPHVLVIDEVGYLSYGPDAANVLYHVVNDRHLRRRPMVFTAERMGASASRSRPRRRDPRSGPRARPLDHPRRAVRPNEALETGRRPPSGCWRCQSFRKIGARISGTHNFAMFPVDPLHQLLRHSCSDHKRETIALGRRFESILGRAHQMAVWKSIVKARLERALDRTTPAKRLADEPWQLLIKRIFSL